MKKVIEPKRKSLFEVVQENLRAAGRTTYITRVVYFGEYFGPFSALQEEMEAIIQDLSTDYSDVVITGLLLVYPDYYVHVLEASEDVIYKHFKMMYGKKNEELKFGRALPLPSYHHVHQRFFTGWFHVYTVPSVLLENLEVRTLSDIQKQVSNCLTKIYGLCEHIMKTVRDGSIEMKELLQYLGERASRYLPESTVIKFLLSVKTPALRSIEDYLKMYMEVPFVNFYNDRVWPAPSDFMPHDVLAKYDRWNTKPNTENEQEMCRSLVHQEINKTSD